MIQYAEELLERGSRGDGDCLPKFCLPNIIKVSIFMLTVSQRMKICRPFTKISPR